ncbi:uncharacterized protein [Dysidea avara]|uniref:uncharacterized protein isoform X2 n=1 Tax=Dysidea avara TaxID=196820 RepID=UPI00331C85ED
MLRTTLTCYLMALFTSTDSTVSGHVSTCELKHQPKTVANRNGLTLHTPSWNVAAAPATPPNRVKVANEIVVERMKELHSVQQKVRGRLAALQEAIQLWQASSIMSHTSLQEQEPQNRTSNNRDVAAQLCSRLEHFADDNYSSTDSSSADELWDGSHANIRTRRRVLRSSWDRNYAHMRSRWVWLLAQYDLVKSKLPPSTKDRMTPSSTREYIIPTTSIREHIIPNRDRLVKKEGCLTPNEAHVIFNETHMISDEDDMTEHCARTEPVNRKRPHQLLWQHQMNRPQTTSSRWQLDEPCGTWLDQSLLGIHSNHSYVTQYSSVAKRQRSLSLQLGRRGYYGSSEEDSKHGTESPDLFLGYHGDDVSHHGDGQEADSPGMFMRHMMSNSRKKRSAEYDINSFVIPYSIASSARPEKLEYKEIPTPGWRVCPVKGTSQVNGFGDHCEDTSDKVFATRHAYCEQLEQQRFLHMCAVASNKRRGSTRHPSLLDTASPSSPSPTPVPMVRRVPPKLDEDDTRPVVLPWTRRKFPLTDEEETTLVSSITSSPLDTPVFSPTESPSNQWTIVSPLATPLTTTPPMTPSSNHADHKSAIVLRLAKRT